ncbi:hypothetical protein [Cetobacterium sp.]
MSENTNNNEIIKEKKSKKNMTLLEQEEELQKKLNTIDNHIEKLKKVMTDYKKERKVIEKELEFVSMKIKLEKLEEEKKNWENSNKGN